MGGSGFASEGVQIDWKAKPRIAGPPSSIFRTIEKRRFSSHKKIFGNIIGTTFDTLLVKLNPVQFQEASRSNHIVSQIVCLTQTHLPSNAQRPSSLCHILLDPLAADAVAGLAIPSEFPA